MAFLNGRYVSAWRLGLLLSCLGFLPDSYSQPASFPERPVTVVIPMGAGGASDTLMRLIAPALSANIGQPVVVDNRPGANGLIGEEYFARAKPDGYTLMLGTISAATNLWLHKLSYEPSKAFVPVTHLAAVPMVLIVNSKLPVKSVNDYVQLAKTRKPHLTYGSWGEGSISHIASEEFNAAAGIELMHIPYKTSPQALNDTLSGHVDSMFIGLAAAGQQSGSGNIRILAITSPTRSSASPEVPTMAESGYPAVQIESWFGIFVPAGTSDTAIDFHRKAFAKTLGQQDITNRLNALGYRVVADRPEEFNAFFQNQIKRNQKIIRSAQKRSGDGQK